MRFDTFKRSRRPAEATDFLRRNDRLAALLPAAERMGALQADCAAALPAAFKLSEILACEDGQLLLSVPNAAVAAKLKQQLPKLQEALQQKGWQINNIRLRVQMMKSAQPLPVERRQLALPDSAVHSFDQLSKELEETAQNRPLIAALRAMVARRRPA
ncbi:DciA family protein [Massilia sp. BJB1822]|uniref:DciA family protein n=1 Tax=Massilia sp. BJB1822 TaxID=2744470 RepID=UPI0015941766|nr:DciA family protein [Massilia sp. BJB1822]NVD99154.1 DUF721 domain-containing protein [Massilia sp. BJB1822]